jgi:hypothetical protein
MERGVGVGCSLICFLWVAGLRLLFALVIVADFLA